MRPFPTLILCAACLLSPMPTITWAQSGQREYRYTHIYPPAWDNKGKDIAVRVDHSPQATFQIVAEPVTASADSQQTSVSIWLLPFDSARQRFLLPVPQPKPDEDDGMLLPVDRVFVSPYEQFLLTSQKIAHGVNAVLIYQKRSDGNGYSRIDSAYLTDRAAEIAMHGKMTAEDRLGTFQGAFLLLPRAWRGEDDRYLDIELSIDHEGVTWLGTLDTKTNTIREIPPGDFRPGAPANPGERYPQTRQRRLTEREITVWSYANVRYAINEIYARHGFPFFDAPAIAHQFAPFTWYRPRIPLDKIERIEKLLTPVERYNVQLLARRRNSLRPPAPRTPASG